VFAGKLTSVFESKFVLPTHEENKQGCIWAAITGLIKEDIIAEVDVVIVAEAFIRPAFDGLQDLMFSFSACIKTKVGEELAFKSLSEELGELGVGLSVSFLDVELEFITRERPSGDLKLLLCISPLR